MSRVSKILIRARDTLNDPNKDRWSDDILLRYMNEGQKDIAIQARLLKDSAFIPLVQGVSTYNLPDDCLLLRRVEYQNKPLVMRDTSYMDNLNSPARFTGGLRTYNSNFFQEGTTQDTWRNQTTTSNLQAVIYDFAEDRELRVYPRPFNDDLLVAWIFNSLYGVLDTYTEVDKIDLFGVLNEILDSDEASINIDLLGVTVEGADVDGLTIYYTQYPQEIVTVGDTIEIEAFYDTALKFWITGMALRDDLNVQNRTFGIEELEFYNRELDNIKDLSARNYVTSQHHETHYNAMG